VEAIYHGEGRCTPNGTAFFYEYTIEDHLGNARVNFRANGAAATHLEEMHYYPFGMLIEGLGTVSPINDYSYNGKELNDDFGLNLSDYGARWYDASVGRWWGVDPLAEKYGGWSGYNYTMGNPVRFIDPDGMSVSTITPIGVEATKTYTKIKENASPERKAVLERLDKSPVQYNISFAMAEDMPGTSIAYTTGSISTDGTEAIVNIIIGENDEATNIATLGDELEHARQFEDNELAIAINSDGTSGILAYDPVDEGKSKDASIEASKSVGFPLNEEQKDWETAKSSGTQDAYFKNHAYEFNGGASMSGNLDITNEQKQAVANKKGRTFINRENGKTNIIKPNN
jgi:RHS repeat-associated protein